MSSSDKGHQVAKDASLFLVMMGVIHTVYLCTMVHQHAPGCQGPEEASENNKLLGAWAFLMPGAVILSSFAPPFYYMKVTSLLVLCFC